MPTLELQFFQEREQGVKTRVSGSEGDEAGGVAVGALCVKRMDDHMSKYKREWKRRREETKERKDVPRHGRRRFEGNRGGSRAEQQ